MTRDSAGTAAATEQRTLQLVVSGMTCTSCAARIEKKLNRLEGVAANVNYATERATVSYDPASVAVATLLDTVRATGYSAQPETPAGDDETGPADGLGRRVLISAGLALVVLVLAMIPPARFAGWQWVGLVLTTPVVFWGGWPLHSAALLNLRHRAASMDTLVSIGTLAAYAWSFYALTAGNGDTYLEVAAVVVVFVLGGRFLEARAKRAAGAALHALLGLGAKEVSVLRDGTETRIPIEGLRVGDVFVVRPGEKVATDAVVIEGSSAIDRSLLTGETVPVEVGVGAILTGATINAGGRLLARATRVGADTQLARLGQLVLAAQSGKAPVQRLADRISAVFVPVVLGLAGLTLGLTLLLRHDVTAAFTAAVAVLIVACPCALGLATPTALLVGTGRGAQLGLVIKGPEVLERTRRVDTIVFDKTGTLTTGRMTLLRTHAADGIDPDRLLRLTGALEAASEHPIGAAITAAARARLGELPAVTAFLSSAGLGVSGTVSGVALVAGRAAFLAAHGLAVAPALAALQAAAEAEGATAVLAGWDGQARGVFVVGDTVKATSTQAVTELRALGLRPVLLTGDSAGAAAVVARAVGIDPADVHAGVSPEQKLARIRDLQADGAVVAMVGDGVNDAAALAQADLGLALGTGTDVAIEAGDITLVSGELPTVATAIALSRRTLGTIRINLFWAFAYNVVLIPVAAFGLLNPLLAGLAMACSSLFVVTNSLRLRRFQR